MAHADSDDVTPRRALVRGLGAGAAAGLALGLLDAVVTAVQFYGSARRMAATHQGREQCT